VGVGAGWANHEFTDVPDPSFFHESVTAIGDAGCALGFPDGRFQPNVGATRGQFAFWLNNCGGRVEFNETTNLLDGTSDSTEEENGVLLGLISLSAGQTVTVVASTRLDNSPSSMPSGGTRSSPAPPAELR
jgi:hypothetical protein